MRIYRDILQEAWRVLWHAPWLWVFGLVAALIGGSGEYGSIVNSIDRIAQQGAFLESLRGAIITHELQTFGQNMMGMITQQPGVVLGTILGLLLLTILIIWVVIVSQAALIQSVAKIETFTPTSFTNAASEGAKKFWPLFWINIVAKLFTALVMAVALLPFLISFLAQGDDSHSFSALIITSFLIFVPLALLIAFILKYAAIAVVLDDLSWWKALNHAINLFFRNWLVSIEMAGLMFLVSFVLSVVVFSLIPSTFGIELAVLANKFTIINLLRVLPTAIILLLAGAWYSTFQYAAWTILYRRFSASQIVPKLLRVANDIPEYLETWMNRTQLLAAPKKSQDKK